MTPEEYQWLLDNRDPAPGGTRLLEATTTEAATTAVTTEEDLWTYSLPANTLGAEGQTVRVTARFSTAANVNAKTMRLYFDGVVVANSSTVVAAPNGQNVELTADIIRKGFSTQMVVASVEVSGASRARPFTDTTATTSSAVTIKATGQNGVAAANDIVFQSASVELLTGTM